MKEVPDFKQLNEQDQVVIIRNAAIEVLKLSISQRLKFSGSTVEYLRLLQLRNISNRDRTMLVPDPQTHVIGDLFFVPRQNSYLHKINSCAPTPRRREGFGKIQVFNYYLIYFFQRPSWLSCFPKIEVQRKKVYHNSRYFWNQGGIFNFQESYALTLKDLLDARKPQKSRRNVFAVS